MSALYSKLCQALVQRSCKRRPVPCTEVRKEAARVISELTSENDALKTRCASQSELIQKLQAELQRFVLSDSGPRIDMIGHSTPVGAVRHA